MGSLKAEQLYKSIYQFWCDTTPLFGDCGTLCNKACCESDDTHDEETGMYLFPGEKALFKGHPNFKVVSSDFTYGNDKNPDIVICKGPCSREARPLSCRIFPLIPYFRENSGLKIIIDPRAKHLCPLAQNRALPYLNPDFLRKIEKTFLLLTKFPEVRSFLEGLSDILDDYFKFDPTEETL